MKSIKLLVALLFAMPLLSPAQYLNRLYDYNNSSDWGYNAFVQPDGNYFLIGSASKSGWTLMTKTIDTTGTELSSKETLKASGTFSYYPGNPGGVKRLKDGGYIMPVSLVRSYFSSVIRLAGLAKLDAHGDTVWLKWHSDSFQHNEFANDCNLMPDGGFITATTNGSLHVADAFLRRTDSMGNVLWTVTNGTDGFYTCQYIGNGRILAGGMWTSLKYIGSNFWYYPSRPRFMIYDTLGNLIKDTLYSSKFSGGGRIYKDDNGGFYHWGAFDSLLYPSSPNSIQNFPEYVAHLDDSLKVVWTKSFASKTRRNYIWNVKQLLDGSYLLMGQVIDANLAPFGITGAQGWAMKLDRNGFVLWDNHYYIDSAVNDNFLVDATERPDRCIVMTGSVGSNGSTHGQDVWVVVVDSMGCIIPNCAPTSVPQVTQQQAELNIYPNPTKGDFFVKASEAGILNITNLHGQQVMTVIIKQGENKVVLKKRQPVFMLRPSAAAMEKL